ncbi:hypothetical protein KTAU_25760 [Thermogemmatispora aurantia]|uniref:Uncharacterized protein n=1 Tax=Thermogemmatispora aurantia TaxID=2045279 RepID=A0A5J4KB15_9CHLR|nr:hypothetical protein [Thermogemmatispora aurantia]GER83939.1 hypothetical protein KTAU_25760 [Thermogemmatispora aurantia]
MATLANGNDPRVKLTRQLLLQAFISLLEERQNILSISVQDSHNEQKSIDKLFMLTLKTNMPS